MYLASYYQFCIVLLANTNPFPDSTVVADQLEVTGLPFSHTRVLHNAVTGGISISFRGWEMESYTVEFLNEMHNEDANIVNMGNDLIWKLRPDGCLQGLEDCEIIVEIISSCYRLSYYTRRLVSWGGIYHIYAIYLHYHCRYVHLHSRMWGFSTYFFVNI